MPSLPVPRVWSLAEELTSHKPENPESENKLFFTIKSDQQKLST